MQSKAATVAEFLKSIPPAEAKVLTALRKEVRAAAPDAEESMFYGMPTYGYGEEMICAFNLQKNYLCLYVNPKALDPHRAKLKPKPGKSCVRFTLANPLPAGLASELVRVSAEVKRKALG